MAKGRSSNGNTTFITKALLTEAKHQDTCCFKILLVLPSTNIPSLHPSLLPSLPEPCLTMVTRVKITNKNIPPTESVQESLERRFGRVGGRIPITPSQSFQERISVRSCVAAVRLAVMLRTSYHQNFSTFLSHSLLTLLTVSRINIEEIRFGLVREVNLPN